MRVLRLCAAFLFSGLVLSGCANFDKDNVFLSHLPQKELYWRAHDQMVASNYKSALNLLSILQVSYPDGLYVKQAMIDTAYINYLQSNVAEAIAACDHFLALFPESKEAPYVMYLKGIIYFYENENFLARMVRLDVSTHDQQSARRAFAVFGDLIKKYPNSMYVPDARQHMVFLVNLLARSELHITLYALRHSAYIAAVNRAWRLLELYPQCYQTEQALAILVYAYHELHFYDLSEKAYSLLSTYYPHSLYLTEKNRQKLIKSS